LMSNLYLSYLVLLYHHRTEESWASRGFWSQTQAQHTFMQITDLKKDYRNSRNSGMMPAGKRGSIWFPTAPDTTRATATAAAPISPPLIRNNMKREPLPANSPKNWSMAAAPTV